MNCATCQDKKKTYSGMNFRGPNHAPMKLEKGPCPVCSGGEICPRCYYSWGMDDDDAGKPKCRKCGWSAAQDETNIMQKEAE